jgi:hypothetical protein
MTLLYNIRYYLVYIFTFQFITEWKLNRLAKQTMKVARQLAKERVMLKSEINNYVRITYGLDANSDFIPTNGVNRAKLHAELYHRYGHEMKRTSLVLTKQLRWK